MSLDAPNSFKMPLEDLKLRMHLLSDAFYVLTNLHSVLQIIVAYVVIIIFCYTQIIPNWALQ